MGVARFLSTQLAMCLLLVLACPVVVADAVREKQTDAEDLIALTDWIVDLSSGSVAEGENFPFDLTQSDGCNVTVFPDQNPNGTDVSVMEFETQSCQSQFDGNSASATVDYTVTFVKGAGGVVDIELAGDASANSDAPGLKNGSARGRVTLIETISFTIGDDDKVGRKGLPVGTMVFDESN